MPDEEPEDGGPASASANFTCKVWPRTLVPSRELIAACASPGSWNRTKPYLQQGWE